MSLNRRRGSLMDALVSGRRWAFAFGTAGLLFAGQYAQAEEHTFVCVCPGCAMAASGSDGDSSEPAPLQNLVRWSSTATDGSTGARGDAITLTWGIVADGTAITPAYSGESSDPSDLISRLDTIYYGSAQSGAITNRVWFDEFEDSYNRWGELSGLTFVYEANDNGSNVRTGSSGSLGSVADLRIGGHDIDGNSGTLAYNYYPNNGNMVIDTNDTYYNNTNSDSIRLSNILMHEVGHAIGIAHLESNNSSQLMEPFINTSFYGPQHDDILSAQRYYGDALEKGSGNDTTGNATSLGTFVSGAAATFSVGTDADDSSSLVTIDEDDFISIDGTSDVDVFSFTLDGLQDFNLSILMGPKGPTYNEGPQGGSQSALNTKALSDLEIELLNSGGSVITTASANGVGLSEVINATLAAGDYFVRVSTASGAADDVQMYRLDVTAEMIPEPSTLYPLAIAGLLLIRRGRRRAA